MIVILKCKQIAANNVAYCPALLLFEVLIFCPLEIGCQSLVKEGPRVTTTEGRHIRDVWLLGGLSILV